MHFYFILFYVFITTISFSSYAQWFESQGQAYINKDIETARTKAIENALKKTLLVSGASVSSIQQVVNGLLTKDELNIRSKGVINAFEIINETRLGKNIIEVTIRADVFPSDEDEEQQCYSVDYRKPILLTRSLLVPREQANIGGIYSIDRAVTQKLSDHIKNSSRFLNVEVNLKTSTSFFRLHKGYQEEQIKDLTKSLARTTDNQFVIYSEINDISVNTGSSSKLKIWKKPPNDRDFSLVVYVYDGLTGEQVFEQSYYTNTLWPKNKRQNMNPNSHKFWTTDYGEGINSLLQTITIDIDEALQCQPSQAKIINVDEEKLLINIGKHHGVKVGDEFSLLLHNNFILQSGKRYDGFNVSPYKVRVTSVTRHNAILQAVNDERLGNVQVNDLVVRY